MHMYTGLPTYQVKNLEIVHFKGLKLKELQPEPSEDQKKRSHPWAWNRDIWPTNLEIGGAKPWVFAFNLWELATVAKNREIEITECLWDLEIAAEIVMRLTANLWGLVGLCTASIKLVLHYRIVCSLVAFLASQWYHTFQLFSNFHFLGLAFFHSKDIFLMKLFPTRRKLMF